MDQEKFPELFEQLQAILKVYEPELRVSQSGAGGYQLDSTIPYKGNDMMFGAVKINKNYVSFHLMPVYMFPDLLEPLSPELKKRMQGKSCFNFKKADETLLLELEDLTRKSYDRFREQGWA